MKILMEQDVHDERIREFTREVGQLKVAYGELLFPFFFWNSLGK